MNPKLSFMLEIIQKLGEFQHQYFRTEIEFEEKTRAMDVVSFVDRECEQMFHNVLREKFPGDYVMGEETFDPEHDYSQHEKLWIIDPMDGTLMYQRGIPTYGPMIAYIENGVVQYSAIFLPELSELYYADETGSYRNNQKIQVSKIDTLGSSLIHSSTSTWKRVFNNDTKYCHFVDSIGQGLDTYSCAFALSMCASGGIDGGVVTARTHKPWDSVPGSFLIQQAGGKVTNIGSDTWDIFNSRVIYSNGLIHNEFQKALEV